MDSRNMTSWELRQAQYYDRMATEYEAHYSDPTSQRYREKFINDRMFEGIDLAGKCVLDAMCGSGQTTEYLMSRGARVASLDISAESIAALKRKWPDCDGVIASILDTQFENDTFDCLVIVGGLHHLHPGLDDGLNEIHRVLKPGGFFCFLEPHAGSLPDLIRNRWYKRDPLFEKNEAAIDLDDLMAKNRDRFHFRKREYGGSIAYLLVLQSMVFRVPLRLKRLYAPLLMAFESTIKPLLTKRLACFAICQWQKK